MATRTTTACRGIVPSSWKHLPRQKSGEQTACVSQQGQSEFLAGCLSAPCIIFSQSVIPDMSVVCVSVLAAAARKAAHADPIGATVIDKAMTTVRMMRRCFKQVHLPIADNGLFSDRVKMRTGVGRSPDYQISVSAPPEAV